MTNYNKAFEQAQYQAVSDKAVKYFKEQAKSLDIPLITTTTPDALSYRHRNFLEPEASRAGYEYSRTGRKGSVVHNYTDIDLFAHQLTLSFDINDKNKLGEQTIADMKDVLIQQWALDVDDANFHGPKNDQGLQLAEGIIGQLTSTQNLSSASNEDCSTKGEIWLWLTGMIDAIPLRIREGSPYDMILFINEKTYTEAKKPDRIYQDKVEWDFIYENYMGPKAVHGRKIGKVVITDKINAEATDDTDGSNADTVDTLGTHGRMLLMVPDPAVIGRIQSRGFTMLDEKTDGFGITQEWAYRGRAYVFDSNGVKYSEALTF